MRHNGQRISQKERQLCGRLKAGGYDLGPLTSRACAREQGGEYGRFPGGTGHIFAQGLHDIGFETVLDEAVEQSFQALCAGHWPAEQGVKRINQAGIAQVVEYRSIDSAIDGLFLSANLQGGGRPPNHPRRLHSYLVMSESSRRAGVASARDIHQPFKGALIQFAQHTHVPAFIDSRRISLCHTQSSWFC